MISTDNHGMIEALFSASLAAKLAFLASVIIAIGAGVSLVASAVRDKAASFERFALLALSLAAALATCVDAGETHGQITQLQSDLQHEADARATQVTAAHQKIASVNAKVETYRSRGTQQELALGSRLHRLERDSDSGTQTPVPPNFVLSNLSNDLTAQDRRVLGLFAASHDMDFVQPEARCVELQMPEVRFHIDHSRNCVDYRKASLLQNVSGVDLAQVPLFSTDALRARLDPVDQSFFALHGDSARFIGTDSVTGRGLVGATSGDGVLVTWGIDDVGQKRFLIKRSTYDAKRNAFVKISTQLGY
jgi:hypothetical protein